MCHISFKECSKTMWPIELVCFSIDGFKQLLNKKNYAIIMENKEFKWDTIRKMRLSYLNITKIYCMPNIF